MASDERIDRIADILARHELAKGSAYLPPPSDVHRLLAEVIVQLRRFPTETELLDELVYRADSLGRLAEAPGRFEPDNLPTAFQAALGLTGPDASPTFAGMRVAAASVDLGFTEVAERLLERVGQKRFVTQTIAHDHEQENTFPQAMARVRREDGALVERGYLHRFMRGASESDVLGSAHEVADYLLAGKGHRAPYTWYDLLDGLETAYAHPVRAEALFRLLDRIGVDPRREAVRALTCTLTRFSGIWQVLFYLGTDHVTALLTTSSEGTIPMSQLLLCRGDVDTAVTALRAATAESSWPCAVTSPFRGRPAALEKLESNLRLRVEVNAALTGRTPAA